MCSPFTMVVLLAPWLQARSGYHLLRWVNRNSLPSPIPLKSSAATFQSLVSAYMYQFSVSLHSFCFCVLFILLWGSPLTNIYLLSGVPIWHMLSCIKIWIEKKKKLFSLQLRGCENFSLLVCCHQVARQLKYFHVYQSALIPELHFTPKLHYICIKIVSFAHTGFYHSL